MIYITKDKVPIEFEISKRNALCIEQHENMKYPSCYSKLSQIHGTCTKSIVQIVLSIENAEDFF